MVQGLTHNCHGYCGHRGHGGCQADQASGIFIWLASIHRLATNDVRTACRRSRRIFASETARRWTFDRSGDVSACAMANKYIHARSVLSVHRNTAGGSLASTQCARQTQCDTASPCHLAASRSHPSSSTCWMCADRKRKQRPAVPQKLRRDLPHAHAQHVKVRTVY